MLTIEDKANLMMAIPLAIDVKRLEYLNILSHNPEELASKQSEGKALMTANMSIVLDPHGKKSYYIHVFTELMISRIVQCKTRTIYKFEKADERFFDPFAMRAFLYYAFKFATEKLEAKRIEYSLPIRESIRPLEEDALQIFADDVAVRMQAYVAGNPKWKVSNASFALPFDGHYINAIGISMQLIDQFLYFDPLRDRLGNQQRFYQELAEEDYLFLRYIVSQVSERKKPMQIHFLPAITAILTVIDCGAQILTDPKNESLFALVQADWLTKSTETQIFKSMEGVMRTMKQALRKAGVPVAYADDFPDWNQLLQ